MSKLTNDYIKDCLMRLLAKKIKKGIFCFNYQNTEDLSVILYIIFKKLKIKKINNEKEFNIIIDELLYNMDLLHMNFNEIFNKNNNDNTYNDLEKKILSRFNIPIEMACLINKYNKIFNLKF